MRRRPFVTQVILRPPPPTRCAPPQITKPSYPAEPLQADRGLAQLIGHERRPWQDLAPGTEPGHDASHPDPVGCQNSAAVLTRAFTQLAHIR